MSQPVLSPATVRRGEVWWVDLDPTRGSEIRKTRPALVLTADALNRARRTVVVVVLSTGPTPRPPIVVATASAGGGQDPPDTAHGATGDDRSACNRGRRAGRAGLVGPQRIEEAERVLLGQALSALRRERGKAWNAACDRTEIQGKQRPSLKPYGIEEIKRLARRFGTHALHWTEC